VANIGDEFGCHPSLPAETADGRSVGSPGWTTL
jgi:hypothetical protein